jgi:hypothetical protein
MLRGERLTLRTAMARALRWAERTAALAREVPASDAARESMRRALLATEDLARRVEEHRRALLSRPPGAPARGE